MIRPQGQRPKGVLLCKCKCDDCAIRGKHWHLRRCPTFQAWVCCPWGHEKHRKDDGTVYCAGCHHNCVDERVYPRKRE